ncbi:MAG: tyrosine-type recombinase/integrase [Thermodesulfobacteriota bacterium]|nr:tyrosine-type recombinase/integrase [Thermodesulfobacteriota bacterium]
MDVGVIIVEFKKHLKAWGYAEGTVECYCQYLSYFLDYLLEHDITELKKVNHQTVLDYQVKVMSMPLAMETKALRIRPIKRLFEYLVESHRLLIDPTEGIVETNRKHRKLSPVLTVDEMKRLLLQPNLSLKSQIRDRAVMEVLYSTGIRLDELLNIEVYHVDLKDKVLYIRKAKGRKQRVVPLGKDAVKYLREYLEKIRPWWARKNRKERKLFLNHYGFPLNPQSVRGFLRTYRIAAKIKKPVSPHTFRRTCATHLLQQGADIRYVQKLLGHSHIKTTQIYTKVMPVDIKETHNKTHPNAKGKKSDNGGDDED